MKQKEFTVVCAEITARLDALTCRLDHLLFRLQEFDERISPSELRRRK